MRIKVVRLRRFRSFFDQSIEFDTLTALVGANGAGKSTVLRGIKLFYDSSGSVAADDFYNRDDSSAIEIAITYTDLGKEESPLFSPYLDNGDLTVTKVITPSGFKYHGTRLQHAGFMQIREIAGKRDRANAYKQLASRPEYSDLPASVRSADEADGAMSQWEAAHRDRCEMLKDDGQFFGFRQVGASRLERFTRYVFIPAVRDAERDAGDSRGSAIFDLMELVVRSVLAQDAKFIEFRDRVQNEYRGLISPDNIPQLGRLSLQLTQVLKQYVPTASVLLDWLPADEMSIPMPKAGVRLEEDGFTATVDRVGHGLQRAFILSLLQSLVAAQVQQSSESLQAGEPDLRIPDLILGIEEPELYQHPNRQRHLARILSGLSQGTIPGVAKRTQVIYCTHSPLFLDISRFGHVRRLSKEPNDADPSRPLVSIVTRNSLAIVAQKLEQAQDQRPTIPFTAQSLKTRLAGLMTPWINEGFFADAAVLVEGEDDRAAVLGSAMQQGVDLEALGIAVIPCVGKNNIDRVHLILAGLGIPTYIMFDGDARKGGDGARSNRILQRLLALEPIRDFPATMIGDTYAIWSDCLEAEIRSALGEELYVAMAQQFMKDHSYPDLASCRKSPGFFQALLTVAAEKSQPIKCLTEVVTRISGLTAKAAN